MVGGGELGKRTEDERHGIRLMLVRTHGCRICVALDAVEGIFELGADASAATMTLPSGTTVPLVDWADVTGAGTDGDDTATQAMVLRTASGPVALRIDGCLACARSRSHARRRCRPGCATPPAARSASCSCSTDGRT
jgi:hypothetical protein